MKRQIIPTVALLLTLTLSFNTAFAMDITGKWTNDTDGSWEFLDTGLFYYYSNSGENHVFGNYSVEDGVLYCGIFPFGGLETTLSFVSYDLQASNGQMQMTDHSDGQVYTYRFVKKVSGGVWRFTANQDRFMYGNASRPDGENTANSQGNSNNYSEENSHTVPIYENTPKTSTNSNSPNSHIYTNINIVGAWTAGNELLELTEEGFVHFFIPEYQDIYGTYHIADQQVNFSFWPNAAKTITDFIQMSMPLNVLSQSQIELTDSEGTITTYAYQGKHNLTEEELVVMRKIREDVHYGNLNIIETMTGGNTRWERRDY